MTRWQMEHEAHKRYGQSIGWMANVINVSHSRPTAKLRGLLNLAAQDRVAPMAFQMDYILIDGAACHWSELEKFTKTTDLHAPYDDEPAIEDDHDWIRRGC